jgi:hypothetical protein
LKGPQAALVVVLKTHQQRQALVFNHNNQAILELMVSEIQAEV